MSFNCEFYHRNIIHKLDNIDAFIMTNIMIKVLTVLVCTNDKNKVIVFLIHKTYGDVYL